MGTNPGQPNLLATGSVQSEIFIWDLNKPANSFSPGAKSAPLADVSQLAWNLEVAHILASCSGGPSALIWDLRACEAKFKCTDPSGKMDCQTIAWNPSGHGVQIAMCSANDAFPVVQMWDLRQEKAPLFERQSHDQNGIVAAEWSCREPIRFISASQVCPRTFAHCGNAN